MTRVYGHLQLDGAFSQYVETYDGQQLVERGLYTTIRHPMYVGSLALLAGVPLLLASTWAWGFALLCAIGLILRIRKEEAYLSREIPGYHEYMRRTWRLVPYLY